MISQQYKVRDINQSAASGSPFAALTLVPVDSSTSPTSPTAFAAGSGADKQQLVPLSGISLADLEAAGIALQDTITLTISKTV